MKKSLIVAVLAVALVFAFASTAMARPNGNIYIEWNAGGTNAAVPTPHAGYTTATEKCNVCHSVHYAAPDNYANTTVGNVWTSTADTQMLLRSSVANACNYCHIDTAIGGVQIYGGDVTNYTTSSSFAHNLAACSSCHAVHGANTFQGGNITKILRASTGDGMQPEVVTGAGANPAIAPLYASEALAIADTDKYTQQVAFCSQCHAEYTDASEEVITGGPGYYNSGGVDYKGHPMKAAETVFDAAGATFADQVAWVDSGTCRSCHDAGNVDEAPGITSNSFPHFTDGFFRFQTAGAFVGDTPAAVAKATDGLCLKCHVNAAQDAGINITY